MFSSICLTFDCLARILLQTRGHVGPFRLLSRPHASPLSLLLPPGYRLDQLSICFSAHFNRFLSFLSPSPFSTSLLALSTFSGISCHHPAQSMTTTSILTHQIRLYLQTKRKNGSRGNLIALLLPPQLQAQNLT